MLPVCAATYMTPLIPKHKCVEGCIPTYKLGAAEVVPLNS